jgi:hypothetical protein
MPTSCAKAGFATTADKYDAANAAHIRNTDRVLFMSNPQ